MGVVVAYHSHYLVGAEGRVCNDQCSDDGCWGKGDHQCLSCKNFKVDERCVESCSDHPNTYENGTLCHHCHEECQGGCSGPVSNTKIFLKKKILQAVQDC